jgi:hypothetical protein
LRGHNGEAFWPLIPVNLALAQVQESAASLLRYLHCFGFQRFDGWVHNRQLHNRSALFATVSSQSELPSQLAELRFQPQEHCIQIVEVATIITTGRVFSHLETSRKSLHQCLALRVKSALELLNVLFQCIGPTHPNR